MAEQMDIKAIEAKLDKNETLTKEEEDFLLKQEAPPEGYQGAQPAAVEEKKEEETAEEKADREKVETDQKAKDALVSRAKAVNLPETATETEIQAAENKKQDEEDEKDPILKIERLLQKPEDKVTEEDLKDFSKREKAYYHQMRRDRKAKQDAEAERDAARFENIKLKKEQPPEKAKEEEKDPLEGKDPTDFITVADVQKILAKGQKKEEVKIDSSILNTPVVQTFLKGCDIIAANEHKEDYEEVMELTEEIINTNPAYQKAVAEAFSKGENPALKIYELIKGDPEYSKLLPAAQTRVKARKAKKPEEPKAKTPEELKKEKEAQEAQDKLEANKNKEKTSGHAEGKDKIEGSDYTIEQITAMSDREFAKLPKKTREKYLEMYG